MTLVDSETVRRGRHRLRFCVGKSVSLYYCSFNMKPCSCGDLVLLTSVSLRRTKPPALWMIYIHGKWQPEQESEDGILSPTGNKAPSPTFIPFRVSSHFSGIAQGAEQSYHRMLPEHNNACLQGPVKYAENRHDFKTASGTPYAPSVR